MIRHRGKDAFVVEKERHAIVAIQHPTPSSLNNACRPCLSAASRSHARVVPRHTKDVYPHPDEQYSCAKGCVETAPLLLTHYPSLSLAHGRNNQRTASHMGVLFTVLDAKTLTREISSKCDVMSVPVLGVHCLVG